MTNTIQTCSASAVEYEQETHQQRIESAIETLATSIDRLQTLEASIRVGNESMENGKARTLYSVESLTALLNSLPNEIDEKSKLIDEAIASIRDSLF